MEDIKVPELPIREEPVVQENDSEGYDFNTLVIAFIAGGLLVGLIFYFAINGGYTNHFLSNESCQDIILNNSILAYQSGIIETANYTTRTGNFTFISNNTIQRMNTLEYCSIIQNLNTNQEAQK